MKYWSDKGKYQKIVDDLQEQIPVSGEVEGDPKLEGLRIICNAYHDYFNNGGGNRFRLVELKKVPFKRGTPASKAASKIKSYAPADNQASYHPMVDGLDELYDTMVDGYIEENYPDMIAEIS